MLFDINKYSLSKSPSKYDHLSEEDTEILRTLKEMYQQKQDNIKKIYNG